jgi:hypothetical protein
MWELDEQVGKPADEAVALPGLTPRFAVRNPLCVVTRTDTMG